MARRKDILTAALKALVAGAQTSALIKIPAAFIAELAALPKEKLNDLDKLSGKQFDELLTQSELSTANAALAAVGTEQIKVLVANLTQLSREKLETLEKLTQDQYQEQCKNILSELRAIHANTKQIKTDVKKLNKKVESIRNTLKNNNDSESENKEPEEKRDKSEDVENLFDAFLSHSHVDENVVERLGIKLEDSMGFRVWLDKWILVPGGHWLQEMAKGLDRAKTCIVCIGRNTPTGWFREEIERALNRQAKDASFRVIPVILPDGDESLIGNFLELRTWVRFADGIDDTNAFRRLSCGIKGIPPGRGPIRESGRDLRVEVVRKKLMKIQSVRDVIDDEVAFEYQRKLLNQIIEP